MVVWWKRIFGVLLATAPLTTEPALAAGLNVEPGLWEVSWSMPNPLGGEPYRQTQRTCVRESTITTDRVNRELSACRVGNAVFEGSLVRWKMRCDTPAGPMTGTGKARSNGTTVLGAVDMSLALGALEIPTTGSFKGKRIGECRAASPQAAAPKRSRPN